MPIRWPFASNLLLGCQRNPKTVEAWAGIIDDGTPSLWSSHTLMPWIVTRFVRTIGDYRGLWRSHALMQAIWGCISLSVRPARQKYTFHTQTATWSIVSWLRLDDPNLHRAFVVPVSFLGGNRMVWCQYVGHLLRICYCQRNPKTVEAWTGIIDDGTPSLSSSHTLMPWIVNRFVRTIGDYRGLWRPHALMQAIWGGLYLSRSGSFYHIFPHIVTHALTPVAHGSNHGGYTDIYRNLTGERILVKLWVIKHCFRLAFLVLCVSGTPKYENML